VVKGKATIGDEEEMVEAGSFVLSPDQIPHALEATEGCRLSVYVMKVPNTKKGVVKNETA